MLIMTPAGLYCSSGDFYIDPKHAVDTAVITHAHSDHARRGSKHYICTTTGVALLKSRLGQKIKVSHYDYSQPFTIKNVTVSFHPAGHILGSSQVRIEAHGEVWVASGDYKRAPDATCVLFEPVKCDVFITEATFGTPAYRWDKLIDFKKLIVDWCETNNQQNMNSVIYAYSLGKAQRVLNLLAEYSPQTIYCHPAVEEINRCYRNQGVTLAPTICLSTLAPDQILENALIITPPSASNESLVKQLGGRFQSAFASGWALKGEHQRKGFPLSDHADWNDLLTTIEQTGAKRVYVQHRSGALIKALKAKGIRAFSDAALLPKNPAQLCLF